MAGPISPADQAENCLQRLQRHLKDACDHARSVQLDGLHRAVADELTHPAMAGDDPLMAALHRQLDCVADEGAWPAARIGSGLTAQQQRMLAEAHREGGRGWLVVGVAVLALLAAAFSTFPWGFAS